MDTSIFPIVITRFPARWNAEEMETYFAQMRAIHDREERFATISDVSATSAMSTSGTRKQAADFMKSEHERSGRLCVGSAVVAPSRLLRGAITAINWANRPPYPQTTVASMGEAMLWVKTQCAEQGLVIR